ncbi:LysE family translocator [Pseudomonas yamanorum]|uniref:LysE family translocator n=1 Tax=Pseudomonas yamanorum TaxID=515393 RepID=A0A7Y8EBK7_9PSED|nr:LysE family translocator [Pseudomonas yamanorum]NVZ84162.1 LysE family translocator [Pseudomonas yamanorum]NWE11405.1 LysE family translocator [Pseudomonas yamanorum]NWE43009.1 LysE family translocator [Pseudomonas yamanorum]NWE77495.1 LysE family translocator [Pseudomonas yamanorum]
MNAPTLILYTSSCLIGALIPGPTSLLAMSNGATRNIRKVAVGMAGTALSDILVIAAVGLGLGAMLMASHELFVVLKWIGVCYLAWLGVQLWRSNPPALNESRIDTRVATGEVFWRSFSVAMTNPKVLLFFTAFLPQFIDPSEPTLPQYAALAVISAGVDVAVMALYATGGGQAAKILTRTGMKRLNRCCGAAMLSLAGFLALYRKA